MGLKGFANYNKMNSSETVNLGPKSEREGSLETSLDDVIRSIASMGGGLDQVVNRLMSESSGLPSAMTIQSFLTGQNPQLQGMADSIANPIINQARDQVGDFMRDFSGGQAVGSAISGAAGSSALIGRQLAGREMGARALSEAVTSTRSQFNPFTIGQQIGTSLESTRQANLAALGNLAGISGNFRGAMSDILSRDLGRLSELRLASSGRSTTQSGYGVGFGGSRG